MLNVGLVGIGAIGRVHFDCWRKSPHGRVAAIVSRDPKTRAGEWGDVAFNLGDQSGGKVDLTGVAAYEKASQLISDPDIQIVDICTATPLHAPIAIAALHAGKHVICEKPMALTVEECAAMEEAARDSGRQLMVAHCLRYWPEYVRAFETIESGKFGRPVYARFHRSGAAPGWSAGGWLLKANESGGVLDLHIHDIDVALWWFGEPASTQTHGYVRDGVPMIVDSEWTYADGPTVHLHGAWDPNGGTFRHAFRLVLEKATLEYDLAIAPGILKIYREGVLAEVRMPEISAHQAELDDFAQCIAEGRPFSRFLPSASRRAVEIGLRELRLAEMGGR